jgi:hypothetical protein
MQDPPEELSEEHSFLIEWLRKKKLCSLQVIPRIKVVLNTLVIITKTKRNKALSTWKRCEWT